MSVGRWLLIALVAVFALVGFLQLTRGTAVGHVRDVAEDAPIPVRDPRFPLSVMVLTRASLAPGNRVEVMLDGDGTFPCLWNDLRSAQRSITLQLYYGGAGRMADTLASILADRARAGVRVLLLYDAFGASDIPAGHLTALRAAGVQVRAFRPIRLSTLHLAQNRAHVRGIVIDGRIGWTGGFGIDDKWYGDGRTDGAWRETNVCFEGPAVPQHAKTFVVDPEWTTIGSMNFGNRSMALNDEATLMLLERAIGRQIWGANLLTRLL
ncbi:MAG TPA: phospholipase D-like domain-containing protein [Vicinamibacterales bacterium]